MTLTVRIHNTAVKEQFLKTMCVNPVALASLVFSTAAVLRVNLVARIKNVQNRVLENRVPSIATVLLENVVILMTNVTQLVLENRVHLIPTVLLENVVVLIINVQQETALMMLSVKLSLAGLLQ